MATLTSLLTLAIFVLFIIGIFSPKTSLFWYKGERTRKFSALLYGLGFVACAVVFSNLFPQQQTEASGLTSATGAAAPAAPKEAAKPDIEIVKHSMTFESMMGAHTIHCRTRNNTDKLVVYMDIKATFYDKDGKIVGTGIGNTANLAGNAEKTIDVMAIGIENADKYEVQVDNVMYQ